MADKRGGQVLGTRGGERRGRRAAELHRLMAEHELTYEATATLLRVSVHTVRHWIKPGSADVPANMLELACLKLREPVPGWIGEDG